MLNKEYFTVKSIMSLFDYFHKSRMLYGMCNFIDLITPMSKLESKFLTGLKNILGLPISTKNDRLKLALGMPDLSIYLKLRTFKNLDKYNKTFGEKCTIYDESLKDVMGIGLSNEQITDMNLREMGLDNHVIVGPDLRNRLKDEMYTWYVSKDHLMLRYMCNRGFFRFDINKNCQHCSGVNSREHAADDCEWYWELREQTMDKIRKIEDFGNLKMSEVINKFYFDPGGVEKKNRESINRHLKNFVYNLYTKQEKVKDTEIKTIYK